MGNLTRDPELRQISSGQSVCRLGLASNRQFKNRQTGAMVQEVCFVDIDVWGAQADSCNQYLQKGRPVLVEGRLKLDSWVDNEGQRKSKHSVVADRVTFLSSAAQAEGSAGGQKEEGSVDFSNAPAQSIPTKAPAKAAPKAESAPSGEVNLQNKEPFEDDLPF